ncbi:hypothetical protein F4778DRAFT_662211 [Xylariomycetidae sp. FL2044]|nr:hypothetical protein F4778DRAFT_662211 [Xylariomycetidae sp. FL2044]
MALGVIQQLHTRDQSESYHETRTSLADLLCNTLVLHHTIPYLTISSILSLAATSRLYRELLRNTPGVFRHIDLTNVKAAQFDIQRIDHGGQVWRNVQLDENLTEDDFYSGPMRGIAYHLRRLDILHDVQTLVLDGLSVTAEFCNDILTSPSFRVRILSIREVKNLNERRLMQALRYACRPSRPEGTPRLQGLYVFGKRDAATALPSTPAKHAGPSRGATVGNGWNHRSQHALHQSIKNEGDDWYHKRGRIISKDIADGWAETMLDCQQSIKFDAVLCTGPRHQNSPAFGRVPVTPTKSNHTHAWGVATFAVGGCASCGSAPEGFTVYGDSPAENLPLLAPVPLHSSNVRSAARPGPSKFEADGKPKFVPRCLECIRERYCFSCDQWWCESCYQAPSRDEMTGQHVHIVGEGTGVIDGQGEPMMDMANGLMDHELAAFDQPKVKCLDCIANTQKRCKACGGGYCIIHHEGSTLTLCDWCSRRRGRRSKELY